MPVIQNASQAPSFFAAQNQSNATDDLISAQIDPTQPQVQGLTSVTDPLVADQMIVNRLSNFDPDLYDLSPDSHLMRLLRALLGTAGVGGLRRQQTINRMSSTMSGTNFLDLDGFWGALFGAERLNDEQPPTVGGQRLDPSSMAADTSTWEAAQSRDGKYRSRITQLAQAFNMGATFEGVRSAAEAVLGCEVDLLESWLLADQVPANWAQTSAYANNWQTIAAEYGTYGAMYGSTWGLLEHSSTNPGVLPLGNRGEVILSPQRGITEEERLQLAHVIQTLAPAGVAVTIANTNAAHASEFAPRFVYADSTDWSIVSSLQQYQGITTTETDVYPNQSSYEAARPAFGRYSGERWSYNPAVSTVTSYQMVAEQQTVDADDQTVTFFDGSSHVYQASEAILDPKQTSLARLSSEGVMSSYPYAPGRFS